MLSPPGAYVPPLWHADDGHARVATLRLVPAMLKPPQPPKLRSQDTSINMSVMSTLQNWGEPQKPDGVKYAISWAKKKGMAIPKEFVKVRHPPPTHHRRLIHPCCQCAGTQAWQLKAGKASLQLSVREERWHRGASLTRWWALSLFTGSVSRHRSRSSLQRARPNRPQGIPPRWRPQVCKLPPQQWQQSRQSWYSFRRQS